MAQNPNLANLDAGQVINRVFNPLNDSIRTDATVVATIAGASEVIIDHVDDSIRIGDGVDLVSTTVVGANTGLDVNIIAGSITGEFTQTGLFTAGRNTTMDVGSSSVALPAVALLNRNSLAITNLSTADVLYIGFNSSVTADRVIGNNSGWEVGPNEGMNFDVRDDIIIYGIVETGKTVRIKIMELA